MPACVYGETRDPFSLTALQNALHSFPDLAEVVDAWPKLSADDRQTVLGIIRHHFG